MTGILKLDLSLWLKKITKDVGLCDLLGSLPVKNLLILFWMKEFWGNILGEWTVGNT